MDKLQRANFILTVVDHIFVLFCFVSPVCIRKSGRAYKILRHITKMLAIVILCWCKQVSSKVELFNKISGLDELAYLYLYLLDKFTRLAVLWLFFLQLASVWIWAILNRVRSCTWKKSFDASTAAALLLLVVQYYGYHMFLLIKRNKIQYH